MFHWKLLAQSSEELLGARDVAETNLACAEGLPDATDIDVPACFKWLEDAAACARQYTEKMLPRFHRKPHEFSNSEAYFRVLCMITVLQRDLGIRYNPEKIPADVPLDSSDMFIHGAILGKGGTCASLPVVYAAVGRRLDYPIRLVAAHVEQFKFGHLFARWDDPHGERFNIECTNKGFLSYSDDYYRTGIYAVSPEVEWLGCLLRSMTPREELANFLAGRAYRWVGLGNWRQAVNSFAWAWSLAPRNRLIQNTLAWHMDKWGEELKGLEPPGYPPMHFRWPPKRFPVAVPVDWERDILCLEATENILKTEAFNRDWWEPLRRGTPPVKSPTAALIACSEERCAIGFRFDGIDPNAYWKCLRS